MTGCGAESTYDPDSVLPSCAAKECSAQIEDLRKAIADTPGIASVDGLEYWPAEVNARARVSGQIRIDSRDKAACDDYEATLGQLVWDSDVSPVSGYLIECFAADATEPSDHATLSFGWTTNSAEEFREQWGERGA